MIERSVKVYGQPAPKGSLKCVGRGGRHQLIEDNKRTGQWRETVAYGGRRLKITPPIDGPIGVEVTITVERPASHYRSGRNAHLLRAGAPAYPTTRTSHDVDKLARLVLDALQDAHVLADDARVVELVARKTYPDSPGMPDRLDRAGAVLRIYPIGDE